MIFLLLQWKQRWGVITKLSPAAGEYITRLVPSNFRLFPQNEFNWGDAERCEAMQSEYNIGYNTVQIQCRCRLSRYCLVIPFRLYLHYTIYIVIYCLCRVGSGEPCCDVGVSFVKRIAAPQRMPPPRAHLQTVT